MALNSPEGKDVIGPSKPPIPEQIKDTRGAKTHRTELIWNYVFQYSGVVVMLLQGVILLPVYLRFISAGDYGKWVMISAIASWVSMVDPGISAIFQQRISLAIGALSFSRARRLVSSGFRISAGIAVTITVVGLLFRKPLAGLVDGAIPEASGASDWTIFWTIAGIAMVVVSNYSAAVGIALLSARVQSISWTLGTVDGLVAGVGMLWLGCGVIALATGRFIGCAIQFVCSALYLQKQMFQLPHDSEGPVEYPNPKIYGEVKLADLGHAAVDKLSGAFMSSLDVLLVGHFTDNETVAAYALNKRPGELLSNIAQKAMNAQVPSLASMAGRGDRNLLIRRLIASWYLFLWIAGFLAISLYVMFESLIGLWVGSKFFLGHTISGALILLCVVTSLAGMTSVFYWGAGEFRGYYRVNIVTSAVSAILMYLGVKWYGLMGLILGMAAPRLIVSVLVYPKRIVELLRLKRKVINMVAVESVRVVCVSCCGLIIAVNLGKVAPAAACWVAVAGFYWVSLLLASKALRSSLVEFRAMRIGSGN